MQRIQQQELAYFKKELVLSLDLNKKLKNETHSLENRVIALETQLIEAKGYLAQSVQQMQQSSKDLLKSIELLEFLRDDHVDALKRLAEAEDAQKTLLGKVVRKKRAFESASKKFDSSVISQNVSDQSIKLPKPTLRGSCRTGKRPKSKAGKGCEFNKKKGKRHSMPMMKMVKLK